MENRVQLAVCFVNVLAKVKVSRKKTEVIKYAIDKKQLVLLIAIQHSHLFSNASPKGHAARSQAGDIKIGKSWRRLASIFAAVLFSMYRLVLYCAGESAGQAGCQAALHGTFQAFYDGEECTGQELSLEKLSHCSFEFSRRQRLSSRSPSQVGYFVTCRKI